MTTLFLSVLYLTRIGKKNFDDIKISPLEFEVMPLLPDLLCSCIFCCIVFFISVSNTPIGRECHELTLLINSQQVAGSPFPMFVSISPTQLEPVEEVDMAVEVTCAKALQQLCMTQANISPAVGTAKCTVDLTAHAEVGKPYVGTLTTIFSNGKPNYRKGKITCHIKSLYNGVITNCAIAEDEPGRSKVQYVTSSLSVERLTHRSV